MGWPRLRQQYGVPGSGGGAFLTQSRRVPIPITFFVVIGVTLALIIFFGAWAVSADVKDRSLAFGLPGTTPTVAGENLPNQQASHLVDRLGDTSGDAGDSWWGQALLKACPLH